MASRHIRKSLIRCSESLVQLGSGLTPEVTYTISVSVPNTALVRGLLLDIVGASARSSQPWNLALCCALWEGEQILSASAQRASLSAHTYRGLAIEGEIAVRI